MGLTAVVIGGTLVLFSATYTQITTLASDLVSKNWNMSDTCIHLQSTYLFHIHINARRGGGGRTCI